MKVVDFYKQSRPVQDRWLDSVHGRYSPEPLLVRYGAKRRAILWLCVSTLAGASLVGLWIAGFGKVESALSLHSWPWLAVYLPMAVLGVVGVLLAVAHKSRVHSLPFVPGLYLFPANLVDARDAKFRVFSLAELSDARPVGRSVRLAFGSESFALPAAEATQVQTLVATINDLKEKLQTNPGQEDQLEMNSLVPPAVVSPLAENTPLSRSDPPWARYALPLGIALGAAGGFGLFWSRNALSDSQMFDQAKRRNTVSSYLSYLERDGRHREEVETVLLPRAKLQLAIRKGTVQAVDSFRHEHPNTGIEAEVKRARRAALVREFEGARAKGKLSALAAFQKKYPNHGIEVFAQTRSALFKAALNRYTAASPSGASQARDWIKALLDYAEKNSSTTQSTTLAPPLEVRFQQLPSETLRRSDAAVQRNPSFNGSPSYPTNYFTEKRLAEHEKAFTKALEKRFGKVFEPEFLRVTHGEPYTEELSQVTKLKTPTMVVRHRVEWSGGAFASRAPRAVFVGILVFFNTRLAVPGRNTPHKSKFTVAVNVPRERIGDFQGNPKPGDLETFIYRIMLEDAFSQFRSKYFSKWFDEPREK